MFGPTLTGRQVVLGQPRTEFIPIYLRWFADVQVTEFLPYRHPPSYKMEEEWIEAMAKSQEDVVWTILLDDRLIGMVGLHQIDWVNRNCAQGIMLGERDTWNAGVGTDALVLTLGYAFLELGMEKVKGYIALPNRGSLKMATRCGYREVGVHRREWYRGGKWVDRWVGEVLRDEWIAEFSRERKK